MNNLQITNSQNNNITVKTANVTNFRGTNVNSISQDKVELSSKKKKLSTEAKVGIGLGILTIIGVGIYKRKSLKNLWEKIFGKGNKKPPKEPNTPPKPTEPPVEPILENNEINFSIVSKDGKKYDLKLEKYYDESNKAPGLKTHVNYIIKNTKSDNVVGIWNGQILVDKKGNKYIHGTIIDTRIDGVEHINGLGTKIKEFIHQEAINQGCKRIEIEAGFGSHVFHNKMGYKSNFDNSENGILFAKELLTAIKNKNALPQYKTKIDTAINSNNINEINELIDEILKSSSEKKLRSQDIGIFGRMIPMVQYL